MLLFTAPAAYRDHLRAVLAAEIARIGSDVKFRGDPDIAHLAPIDARFIDADAQGRLVILFGVAESDAFVATEALQCARRVRETSPL